MNLPICCIRNRETRVKMNLFSTESETKYKNLQYESMSNTRTLTKMTIQTIDFFVA